MERSPSLPAASQTRVLTSNDLNAKLKENPIRREKCVNIAGLTTRISKPMNEYFRFRSAFAEEYARYRKYLVPLLQNGRQFNELIHLTVREKHGFTRDGIQAGIVEQLSETWPSPPK
jgi:hypothetical protein